MRKINQALDELLARIKSGEEFPDVCSKVATKHGVPYDQLREAYDLWCAQVP